MRRCLSDGAYTMGVSRRIVGPVLTRKMTLMTNANVTALSAAGTSTWLDDLSRQRIQSGNLQQLIDKLAVVGVTTNPAIFATAMTKGSEYEEQLAELAATGADAAEAVFTMAIDDVRDACDVFAPVATATDGVDGRVSIEVDPRYAADYDKTISQARDLVARVGRENVLIKIPATPESIPAIETAISEGINVNVTLIFSVERYREVIEAYISGLEKAKAADLNLSAIHSVASFFVSRVDSEVDKRLAAIGTEEAKALEGKAALANAWLAYALYREQFSAQNPRWAALAEAGAKVQRPLWASTSVKNPAYPATLYVEELAAANTVNTMPESTLMAVADAEQAVSGAAITPEREAEGQRIFEQLTAVGVDMADVFRVLETEGVEKFVASWDELLTAIDGKLAAMR